METSDHSTLNLPAPPIPLLNLLPEDRFRCYGPSHQIFAWQGRQVGGLKVSARAVPLYELRSLFGVTVIHIDFRAFLG